MPFSSRAKLAVLIQCDVATPFMLPFIIPFSFVYIMHVFGGARPCVSPHGCLCCQASVSCIYIHVVLQFLEKSLAFLSRAGSMLAEYNFITFMGAGYVQKNASVLAPLAE
jgi:hypothetical protein